MDSLIASLAPLLFIIGFVLPTSVPFKKFPLLNYAQSAMCHLLLDEYYFLMNILKKKKEKKKKKLVKELKFHMPRGMVREKRKIA